ncbi:metallophosphoesterase family protein [Leptonema illini]|uniref:Metallophosphoesterase n=1 Tax=Leptonema illini DSM 21528 TaxID=929563 RepID=H2CLQ1_9LEPT|nr:metallophosphoesterase family protein [Leptonema illini]EHQ04662.1 metallophosphoesterase [Leptonema illini DSM 21528]
MGRTLFIGDIHSDFESLEILVRFMLHRVSGISRVVQVGDFGFWPLQASWLWYPKSKLPVPVSFIDGNHEDHVALRRAASNDATKVSEHYDATYIPRGFVGDGFVYCGGATSYDRAYRTEGLDWFPEENITDEEIRRGIRNCEGQKIRIMVAHETIREAFRLIKRPNWIFADQNRERLEELFNAARPEIYIHGHYHFFSEYEYLGCRFICLQNPDHFKHELVQTEELMRVEGYSARVVDAFMHVAQRCCAVADVEEGLISFR